MTNVSPSLSRPLPVDRPGLTGTPRTGRTAVVARLLLAALMAVSLLPLLPSAPAEASADRSVSVSLDAVPAGGDTAPLTITATGFDPGNALIATVAVDDGEVQVTTSGDVELAHGYDATAEEVTFSGSHSDMLDVLTSGSTWHAPPGALTTEVHVTVTEAPAGDNFFFWPNHPDGLRFYEFVETERDWFDARDDAAGRELLTAFSGVDVSGSVPGYLATITSEAENDFIAENTTASDIWIGASDHVDAVNDARGDDHYANQAAVEGNWYWVTGPEAGTHFWTGNYGEGDACDLGPCSAETDPETGEPQFTSWASGEPNDHGDGEFFAVTNWSGDRGLWNDLSTATRQESYLVEYGGLGDVGLIPSAADSAPLTSVNAIVVEADPVTVGDASPADVTVTLTDAVTDGLGPDVPLLVTLELPEDGGTLHVDHEGRGLVLEEGYAFTGREIGFSGTFGDITSALAEAITWVPPTGVGDIDLHVAVTELPDTTNDVFYNARTGHYYEYVQAPGISFHDALEAAANGTELFGMPGWLATPVDFQQNRFIAEFTTAANVWIGASDSAAILGELDGVSSHLGHQIWAEGRWHWVAGPNTGTEFWRGAADGSPVDGHFNAWAPGEPNNYGTGEHYVVTNWRGSVGEWNDLRNDAGSRINGYLIEYGPSGEMTNTAAQGRDVGMLRVLPELPSAPRAVTAGVGHVDDDHRVTVTWDPPADDGGGQITGYEVSLSPAHGPGADCSGTSCVFPGLQDATTYTVEVAATNAGGTGPSAGSNEVTTIAAGIGNDGPVSAGPGDDFAGVPINATMPADRNGRINIPPGRLSRNTNATDTVAVDVKLPQGLGGCLAIDTVVAGGYTDVDFQIYDDGFQAWVTGPEHRVGRALDDGAVYWDRDCNPADGAPADDDVTGGEFEYGVADDSGNADAGIDDGQSLHAIGFNPEEIGLGDANAHRDVVLRVDDGALEYDGASNHDGTVIDGVTITSLDGGSGLLLSGPEDEIATLLDGDTITATGGTGTANLDVWASSPDRDEVLVTSGRAFARVSVPDDGGELAFDATARDTFVAAGGTVEAHEDGSLLITGPVVGEGEEHDAFNTFLADGITWSPPDEQGSYPLLVELEGDGGFATTLTAPLTFEGAPGVPQGITAFWDDDELVVSWQPGVPSGLPYPTYTVEAGGAAQADCATETDDGYECRIHRSAVDSNLDDSITVSVEASNDHTAAGEVVGTTTTPAGLDDVTLSADTDRVQIDWDPAEVDGDEVRITLDPGHGTCSAPAAAGTCTIYHVDAGETYAATSAVRGASGDSERVSVGSITPLAVTTPDEHGDEEQPKAAADGGAVPLPIDLDLPAGWTDPVTVEVAIPAEAGELHVDGHGGVVSPAQGTTLTFDGTKAEVQAALDDLHWTPSSAAGDHTLTIAASDDDGRTASLSRDLVVYTALSVPTDVAATRDGATVTVTWSAPASSGASPIDRYEVTIGGNSCEVTTVPLECVLEGVSTSLRDVTVTAINADGEEVASTFRLPAVGGDDPGDADDTDDTDEPSPTAPRLGEVSGTVDGEPADLDVSGDDTSVTVSGDGYSLRATPGDGEGTPTGGVEGTSMQLRTGGTALIDASGFAPSSEVRAWLFSDPLLLGTFTVADDGTLEAATGMIPGDVTACAHTLELEGTTAAGQDVAMSLGVWVEADPYPFGDARHAMTHGPQIACVASLGIAQGVDDDRYDPQAPVLRGQMASFLARTLGLDTSGSSDFPDSQGTAHDGAIAAVVEAGVASGYTDGSFRPGDPITREQMASMLAAAANLDVEVVGDRYGDLTGGVHDGAIEAVTAAGIAMGHDDGTYRPTEPVSRAQMASFLVRLHERL